ncbi:MAG: hypothetical protein ONB42_07290 [candidate division KSB1 bacterium]|nr:hypothetical protein [candidate division KSB1 bacterium]
MINLKGTKENYNLCSIPHQVRERSARKKCEKRRIKFIETGKVPLTNALSQLPQIPKVATGRGCRIKVTVNYKQNLMEMQDNFKKISIKKFLSASFLIRSWIHLHCVSAESFFISYISV